MKLSNRFTLWYVLIATVVLLAGSGIMFYQVRHQIDVAQHARQERIHTSIAKRLVRDGGVYNAVPSDYGATVQALPLGETPASTELTKECVTDWCVEQQHEVCKLAMYSAAEADGRWFGISTRMSIVPSEDILASVAKSFVWMAVLLLVLMFVFIKLVAARILAPFERTLTAIDGFDIKRGRPVQLPATGTREFDRLNHFVGQFTEKAITDYRSLKEFSENTSHELQTPLAVIRAKLEMLMATDLKPEQAESISDMHRAVEKLARINRSLVLLAKLENREFTPEKDICLTTAVNDSLRSFAELMEMKGIALRTAVDPDVRMALHPALTDVLLSNLISNAIRHNMDDGSIAVQLDRRSLTVTNTGRPPQCPPDQLFGRFKKGNPECMSAGLGLSIVKQICDLHGFAVDYNYSSERHVLSVRFGKGGERNTKEPRPVTELEPVLG